MRLFFLLRSFLSLVTSTTLILSLGHQKQMFLKLRHLESRFTLQMRRLFVSYVLNQVKLTSLFVKNKRELIT